MRCPAPCPRSALLPHREEGRAPRVGECSAGGLANPHAVATRHACPAHSLHSSGPRNLSPDFCSAGPGVLCRWTTPPSCPRCGASPALSCTARSRAPTTVRGAGGDGDAGVQAGSGEGGLRFGWARMTEWCLERWGQLLAVPATAHLADMPPPSLPALALQSTTRSALPCSAAPPLRRCARCPSCPARTAW